MSYSGLLLNNVLNCDYRLADIDCAFREAMISDNVPIQYDIASQHSHPWYNPINCFRKNIEYRVKFRNTCMHNTSLLL